MYYPNTLDQRRINNSNAKTLLQNWVEERATQEYDKLPDDFVEKNSTPIKHFKNGHRAILSIEEENDRFENKLTTYKEDFLTRQTRNDPNGEAKGIRYRLTEEAIRNQLLNELEQADKANDPLNEPIDYTTEAKANYNVPGFVHKPPRPTAKHDVYSEMPVSYWTEHRNKAHGVTQFKTLDSPFRRNAAFSTPVTESFNTVQPGELENYPYMSQKGHNNTPIL